MASATAYYGLQLTRDLTSAGVTGGAAIGASQTSEDLTSSREALSFFVELGAAGVAEIALNNFAVSLTGAGQSQVATQTIVGTVTLTGIINVVVTSARIEGGVQTVPVSVTNGDSASTVGGKVRAAITGTSSEITDFFTVGGSGADFSLTETNPNPNDPTLNIAYENGTAAGLTADSTSVATTAGICPARVTRLTGVPWASDNFQGGAVNQPDDFHGIEVKMLSGSGMGIECNSLTDVLAEGEVFHKHAVLGLDTIANPGTLTFAGSADYSKALVVLTFNTLS